VEKKMNTTKMLEFLGKESVENDEGWSEEVWRAGYQAAVADAIDMFKSMGRIPFAADEVVTQLEKLQ
jgi:hypothetical protein